MCEIQITIFSGNSEPEQSSGALRGTVGSDLMTQYHYRVLFEEYPLQAFMLSSPLHPSSPSPALLLGWGAAV